MNFNLFDVETGFQNATRDKARDSTEREVSAYMKWRRERLGLPDLAYCDLRYAETSRARRYERGHCIGATFGKFQTAGQVRTYDTGAYSLLMPGYNLNRDRVTMETLDEAGEVIASQTLPVEPKKGGVIWSRDDVRKACGKIAKPTKRQKAPQKPVEDVALVMVAAEPETPALAPEIEPSAPIAAEPTPTDGVGEILARLAALEERVATLTTGSADTVQTVGTAVDGRAMGQHEKARALGYLDGRSGRGHDSQMADGAYGDGFADGVAARDAVAPPTVAERQRTPAHERAVRRAWAERHQARLQRAIAADHLRMREQVAAAANGRERHLQAQLASKHTNMEKWAAEARKGRKGRGRRAAAAERARRMIAASRQATLAQAQRADVAQAQLAKLRTDMADPSQPERASDITRLMRERDEARTALSAVTARAERSEAAVHMVATKLEEMASRVAIAEAALRTRAA